MCGYPCPVPDHEPRDVFFRCASDLFICLDAEGLIAGVNPAWERAFGFAADELAGLPVAAFLHPLEREGGFPGADGAAPRLRCRDGSYRRVRPAAAVEAGGHHCVIARDAGGTPAALAVQQAVADLLASGDASARWLPALPRLFAEPLGGLAGALWVVDAAADRLRCAASWLSERADRGLVALVRRPVARGEGLAGRAWESGRVERERAAAPGPVLACPLRDARVVAVVEVLAGPEFRVEPDLAAALERAGAQLARRLAHERATQEAEGRDALTGAVLAALREAVLVVDALGQVMGANAAAERLFGRPRTAIAGVPLADAVVPYALRAEHQEPIARLLAEAAEGEPPPPLEVKGRRPDGSPFALRLTVDRAGDAEPVLVVSCRDVTGERDREERLARAQRADAVGRLAAGLVHDLNNQLTVIAGHAELLRDAITPDAELGPGLVEVRSASQRAMALTRLLATFARHDSPVIVTMPLNDLVGELEMTLRRVAGAEVQLEVRLDPEVGAVCVEPAALQQALIELAMHARESGPGRVIVETHRERTPAGDRQAVVRAEASRTGRRHEQSFAEVAEAGDLPAAPSEDAPMRAATILLVEDDEGLREVCSRILEDRGYTVLAASEPESALRLAREHAGPIALLVADVVLPSMSGVELAERLRAMRPELRVLHVSGHLENEMVRQIEHASGAFLPKPFLPGALARKVREVLDGA